MEINAAALRSLYLGFKTSFQEGLGMAPSQWEQFVLTVNSQTAEEEYGWLGKMPGFREWIGDRVVNGVMLHDYAIRNKDFENTIGVSRNAIMDDRLGVYAPLFRGMGEATQAHPNELIFNLLKGGWSTLAYDEQYFFDTDHPVLDANGTPTSVANTDNGAGDPWFLMDLSRSMKPIIWQTRKPYDFQALDAMDDPNVFMRKEYIYGVDARANAGFGLWQLAWGSKQTLNAANFQAARQAMQEMKGDYGRPLGLRPTHLVVTPSNETAAEEIVKAERNAAGATNINRGKAEIVVVPWLV